MRETQIWSLGEKIPWRRKWQPTPIGSQRVGQDWRNLERLHHSPQFVCSLPDLPPELLEISFFQTNFSTFSSGHCFHSAAAAAATAKSLQSCPTLCDPIDSSQPGSPISGILQARTLESVAISFSNAWKWKVKIESQVAQSCLTLRDPMDHSLPDSSIHGIFQARVLEWGAIAFSCFHSRFLLNTVLHFQQSTT